MKRKNIKGIMLALAAAALYAVSSPLSKVMLDYVPETLMAGLLYIGAGIGMCVVAVVRRTACKITGDSFKEEKLTKKELPYTVAMIVLDIAAPICLLFGLKSTTAENVSLLNNFEIVATAIIALAVFKEQIGKRLWVGISLVTVSCMVLSFGSMESLKFSYGSLLVLLACVCWGFENNCTRKISSKDPLQIVMLKGVFSGLGSLAIGLCIGERVQEWWSVAAVLGIGLAAYGMSIFCYVYAQRMLGAAKTSMYYAVAPFIGTALSLVIFKNIPGLNFYIALVLMIAGVWLSSVEENPFRHKK